jgi:hypothetical protein
VIAFALVTAVLAAVATQPASGLATSRFGRQASVRFAGLATAVGGNVQFQGQLYNNQPIVATWKVGTTIVKTTTINQNDGFKSFEQLDTGNSGQATLTLTVQTATPQVISSGSCSGISLAQSDRETIVLTSSATAPTFGPSGTCSAGTSGTCTGSTLQSSGQVSFSCSVIRDQLSSARSCSTVPVRVYSNNPACPVLLELADLATGMGVDQRETFLTQFTVPTNFGTDASNNPMNLDRDTSFEINDTPIFAKGTTARFLDLFIDGNGAATADSNPFNTAFLNVANLAYRATAGTRDNSFVLVITQGTDTNVVLPQSEFVNVVDFVANPLNVGSALPGWVEVPAGFQYTLRVYDNSVTQQNIFGTDPNGTGGTSPAALAVGTTASLDVNNMRIFRITNDATTNTLIVNNVPLSTTTDLVPEDTTKFIIWNNVVSQSLQLAAPLNDCCNFLSDDGEGVSGQVFTHNTAGDPNALSPAPRDGSSTFQVFGAGASCPNIGVSVTPAATVALDDNTIAGQCSVNGLFLYARTQQVTTNSCIGPTPVGTTCTNPSSFTTTTSDVIVSMKGNPTDTNQVITQDFVVTISVPLCDCFVEETVCTDVLGCEFQAAFDGVNSDLTVVRDQVNSLVGVVASVQSQVAGVDTHVLNTNSTLHTVGNSNTGVVSTSVVNPREAS